MTNDGNFGRTRRIATHGDVGAAAANPGRRRSPAAPVIGRFSRKWSLLVVAGMGALPLLASDVFACGCLTPIVPPPPMPGEQGRFAVNQKSEQIIFEVSEGEVSAHVRILYEGSPEEFAWLLPMPNVPEIELSETSLFGFVDQQTSPIVRSRSENLCPSQRYQCKTHPPCPPIYTPTPSGSGNPASAADPQAASPAGFGGASAADPGVTPKPPVTVLASAQVGSYDTITFAADEADLAIEWLNDNGFIVNETMSPYMQPYLDSGLVFVASRLIPGAGLDELRPLKLTYEADFPSIPLRLTAIAAEPHMTVTAFIYASEGYQPVLGELVTPPAEALAQNRRGNYSMVLARIVDEAGGYSFTREYQGAGPRFVDSTGCCSANLALQEISLPVDAGIDGSDAGTASSDGGGLMSEPAEPALADVCNVGGDGLCQCPGAAFDAADCDEELVLGFDKAAELAERYPVLTRLTTRISPEEMVEDPMFEPSGLGGAVRANYTATTTTLASCAERVVDAAAYEEVVATEACSAVYCDWGECVITPAGAGCLCDEGFVGRVFSDFDGQPSVTCVPETPTVDFAVGGVELPDACADSGVENGECLALGGFPTARCDSGYAATIGAARDGAPPFPGCSPVDVFTSTPGADNYSTALRDFDVCEVPPPACPADGWLVKSDVPIPGVDCGLGPDPSWFVEPPKPVCPTAASPSPTASATPPAPVPLSIPLGPIDTNQPRPGSPGATEVEASNGNPTSVSPTQRRRHDGCAMSPSRRGSPLPLLLAAGIGIGWLRRRAR